jgi:hypothetical protein
MPVPAGDTAVIVVPFTAVTELAAVDPKITDCTPVKPLPEMVTLVPPPAGP